MTGGVVLVLLTSLLILYDSLNKKIFLPRRVRGVSWNLLAVQQSIGIINFVWGRVYGDLTKPMG